VKLRCFYIRLTTVY